MALESFFERFIMLNKQTSPDVYGGSNATYTEGQVFVAAISVDSSTEAQIAERTGMKKIFTLVVPKAVKLYQHDVVKRVKTGDVLRITGNTSDCETPAMSSLNCSAVTAEVVE